MSAYAASIPLKDLIGNLKKYLDVFFPAPLMEIMDFAEKELMSFIVFVERLDSRSRKRMSALLRENAEAICEFKGVFESHFDKLWRGDQFSLVLEDLKRDTESLIGTLKKTKEEEYCYCYPEDEEAADSSSSSAGNYYMVGLRDQYSKIKERILCGEKHVISLVGMIGIGKTTLARKLFQDLDIVELCVCRAWVTVGKEFKRIEDIVESILVQVDPQMHEIAKGGNETTMVEYLQKSLENKRTLIVLNDVWRTDVIFFLEALFATTKLVRILLTTTQSDIHTSQLVSMRLLDKDESWDLLRVKVFGEESCPPQLEDAGKKIADKCDGLPLTIVMVADLLSVAGKTQESLWIEVATRKKHQIFTEAYDEIAKILYPSYENIYREYYRQCFLYMGVFPIKHKIPRSQIINLWNAERLLPHFHKQDARGVRILQSLAVCSLVMVYQRSSSLTPYKDDRRIKSFRLHSSWWHFCQREAAKTNFFHVVDCPEDSLEEGIKGQSRLSIHNNVLFALKDVYTSVEENCASTARSLLCFGPYHQYQVPICFGLKFLRRLDAVNIRFYEFPLEVVELVELIYLALTCNGKLPSSISKLVELQFLIVHQCASIKSQGALTYLPTQIWYMKKLEHLQIMGNDLPYHGSVMLRNLATLLDVSADSCRPRVLKRIPNLTKLGIRIELKNDAEERLSCLDHISHLDKLESLKCVVVNPKFTFEAVAPQYVYSNFPSNLKKLNLSGLGYPWEEMRKIAPLPNLEVLKLRCNAFEGPKWEIEENEFPKLYFLLLEDIDLVQLTSARGSFESLKYLRIRHCYKLKKLGLGHCQLLSNIDVVDSNPLVEKEVKKTLIEIQRRPEHMCVHSSWKS